MLSPPLVRSRVFELAQAHPPARFRRQDLLEQVGRSLGADPQEVADALYADLPDQQTLVSFEAPDPQVLLDRYNLAQAQGLLYRAYSLIITARRNEPARYKQLISYVKFFGLMVTVEGDSDYGFTLTLDGPTVPVRRHHPLWTESGQVPPGPAARDRMGPVGRAQAPQGPGLGRSQGRGVVVSAHQ